MKVIAWARWRAVLSKLKWLAFCIIRGPVFIRSASGKRDSSETDRPNSPPGKKRSPRGAVAGLVGIEGGVVSGVFNLESSGVRASDLRPRHDKRYHKA